jgi:hypothetical protein
MTTASEVIALARTTKGVGEYPAGSNHNQFTVWYGQGDGPWCFRWISWLFWKLNALDLIHGKHQYVPDAKSIFQPHGQWGHTPRVGALVAFDFNKSGEPEHIGIVTRIRSDGRLETIEGNTDNAVRERVRSTYYVYGYAYPAYSSADWMATIMKRLSTLKKGSTGYDVYTLQGLLNGRVDGSQTPIAINGTFDAATDKRVREEQSQHKIKVDGEVGSHTWAVLITGSDL